MVGGSQNHHHNPCGVYLWIITLLHLFGGLGENNQYLSGRSWRDPGFTQTDRHPVVCVSWNDANAFIEWLYRETSVRYRLPTEAEWEYAARAGTQTPRFWGPDNARACEYASVENPKYFDEGFPCKDGYKYTAPVGTFLANPYKLHDMLGNVWEWTCSAYAEDYDGTEKRCTDSASAQRVLRGGSWNDRPVYLSSAYRLRSDPDYRFSNIGFRLAQDL